MRKVALLCLVLALAGCGKAAVSTSQTDNQEFKVSELFTHKGITVYRFEDAGRYVYFTSRASEVRSSYTTTCGKNCTRVEEQTTLGE